MKLVSIFFTASVPYLRFYIKDTLKRARNMKLVSIFFTASVPYLRFYIKDMLFVVAKYQKYLFFLYLRAGNNPQTMVI